VGEIGDWVRVACETITLDGTERSDRASIDLAASVQPARKNIRVDQEY